MDRVLCVGLCFVVILVSVWVLNYCGEVNASLEETTEPTATEPTIKDTQPMETRPLETEPVATLPAPTEPAPTQPTPTETAPPTEPPTEPAVSLYDVPLSEGLQMHIIRLCEGHDIDPAIVIAVIYRESSFNPNNVGDGGDSLGLMQVQPKWHSARMERLGCNNLFDPYQNVTVGIDYLAENLRHYGDIAKALVAYNQGFYKGVITKYAESVLAYAKVIKNEKKG